MSRILLSDKDLAALIKKAEKQGWQVTKTNGRHLRWKAPSGKVVFSSSTPGDRRSLLNLTSQLKKEGFKP